MTVQPPARHVVRPGPGGTRLPGHTLIGEARSVRTESGRPGRAFCSCGARSEKLTTIGQGKRWHATHKAEIAAAQGGAR